ncbi:hypothetical protein [Nocardia aurea]|uniref:hypothetical protein n=1 Tax=Nocardia aurea TaxID=2144174 RepID=UPI00339FB1B4
MADQTITPEEAEFNALLAELRALSAAATAGPWFAWDRGVGYMITLDEDGNRRLPEGGRTDLGHRPDAELIARMRNELPGLLDRLESGQVFGKAMLSTLNVQSDIALQATGLHHLIEPDGDGDWQAVWETVAELGEQVRRLTRERDRAQAALAAIKAADPSLFDPEGGTNRGEAYERYGTPGHNLRAAYCAAVGIKLEDGEGADDA